MVRLLLQAGSRSAGGATPAPGRIASIKLAVGTSGGVWTLLLANGVRHVRRRKRRCRRVAMARLAHLLPSPGGISTYR